MKNLKKVLALLLVAVMAFSLFACGEEAKDKDNSKDNSKEESKVEDKTLSGKFMLYSMSEEGETFDYATLKELGFTNSYIEFTKDGKYILSLFGEDPQGGTYDSEKKILNDEENSGATYSVDGEKVTITADTVKMVFVKEGSALLG